MHAMLCLVVGTRSEPLSGLERRMGRGTEIVEERERERERERAR